MFVVSPGDKVQTCVDWLAAVLMGVKIRLRSRRPCIKTLLLLQQILLCQKKRILALRVVI